MAFNDDFEDMSLSSWQVEEPTDSSLRESANNVIRRVVFGVCSYAGHTDPLIREHGAWVSSRAQQLGNEAETYLATGHVSAELQPVPRTAAQKISHLIFHGVLLEVGYCCSVAMGMSKEAAQIREYVNSPQPPV